MDKNLTGTKTKNKALMLIGIIVGIANGLFGAGGGTLLVPVLDKSLPTHKAHATALAVILPLSVVSAIVYTFGVDVNWATVGWVSAGGVAGGFVGAKLLKKISAAWLNIIFAAFMTAAAIRMFFA